MAYVITDGYLSLNGVDVSASCKGMTPNQAMAALDATTMGLAATTIFEPGLKSFGLSVSLLADNTDNELDEDVYTLWDGRTKFAIAWRRSKTDAISATNPEWQFTGFIGTWTGGGSVGSLAPMELTLVNSSALVRDVTP